MKEKTKIKFIVIAIIILAVILGVVAFFYFSNSNKETEEETYVAEVQEIEETEEEVEEEPEIEIFSGYDRPVAFMIDNNTNAQPQANLNSAYMIYEIIVEGGETRLMALFKGADIDEVGPIRSSRHYFLNYAMENDAIYVHLGWSPQAQSDISKYDIDNINGQSYDTGKARTDSSLFWRVSSKSAPHNAYTSLDSVLSIAKEKGYSTISTKDSVLNYVASEVTLESEDSVTASTITIPYTTSHTVQYIYNEETGRYTRYSKGSKMTDETTGEDVTTKNLIITFAQNYTIDDGEDKGRQEVVTVGELDGYYITNGKAIQIKCVKSSRSSQTIYTDLDGNEIEVNDGNTWVNICPIDANVTIE